MQPSLDLDALRWIDQGPSRTRDSAIRTARQPRGQRFLQGPITLAWLAAASRQPGKALHVSIALWFLKGLTKSWQVKLTTQVLTELGVDRHAGYRGLAALERAHLVHVVRHRGRQPVVTILEVPTP